MAGDFTESKNKGILTRYPLQVLSAFGGCGLFASIGDARNAKSNKEKQRTPLKPFYF